MIIEIFYIILFIIIFYIYYYITYINKSNKDIHKLINYKFNTGDIILIYYKSVLNYLNLHFTRRRYNHIGIVIDGNKKYIMHIIKNKNLVIEKIDMNFLLNNNILELAILPIRIPINNAFMINKCKKFLNYKYNKNKLIYIDSVNNIIPCIKYSGYNNNTVICYELIALILHDIGIIKNFTKEPYKYNMNDIINLLAYNKKNMKKFIIPLSNSNFNFSIIHLYIKILDLLPIPKFI